MGENMLAASDVAHFHSGHCRYLMSKKPCQKKRRRVLNFDSGLAVFLADKLMMPKTVDDLNTRQIELHERKK